MHLSKRLGSSSRKPIILRRLLPKRNSCSWCGPHRDPTASASSCIFGYPKRTGQVVAGTWCLVVKGYLVRANIIHCNKVVVTGFCLVTMNYIANGVWQRYVGCAWKFEWKGFSLEVILNLLPLKLALTSLN